MSQNFSKMSDIYIPELIELDSYWQKAVEDAIYDTLKGEKRLYYALRNRKKINQKLESLGLKPVCSQMSFSGRYRFSVESKGDSQNISRCKSVSNNTQWDSCCENSATSLRTAQHDDTLSQSLPEPQWESYSDAGSRSRSKACRQTPPDKKYRNPDKPLLGDGSVEKMKKSHNSFYCEPMGMRESLSEEFYESDKDEEENKGDVLLEVLDDLSKPLEDKNKTVKWLHVREDSFDDSDTETSINNTLRETVEKICHHKQPTLKDVNYFMNQKFKDRYDSLAFKSKHALSKHYNQTEIFDFLSHNFALGYNHTKFPNKYYQVAFCLLKTVKNRSLVVAQLPKLMTLKNEKGRNSQIPMMLDPQEDLFWENEVKNAIRESANLDRKLHFALAKREIVNENLQFLRMRECGNQIQINVLAAKTAVRKGRSKRVLSPFIKFYLEVYRELCHKCPLKEITEEATARWWGMTMNQKSVYGIKNNSN